jgi:hypothetical protein
MAFTARWAWLGIWSAVAVAGAAEKPAIFPEPQQMTLRADGLRLDDSVAVVVPMAASDFELSLARALAAEAVDHFGVGLRVERRASLPSGRFILMGTAKSPLVRAYLSAYGIPASPAKAEGYSLHVDGASAVVAGNDESGAFYGMQSARQLLAKRGDSVQIAGVEIDDWPHMPFRAVRLYLPGHENIAFFRRFLRDFMALYKFNKVSLEVNASMRLDSHPELNAGWLDFARDLFHTQRYYPVGPNGVYQNSAHQDTADGEILEKDEVASLVRYAASQHIEVIPEIPTFTHSYFWLTRHRNLAAIPNSEWPDIYDPTKPAIYDMVFDVLDEYIDVMKPKMINIGHDEMFFPIELCEPCKTTPAPLLWAEDIRKIHDHLAARGIRTAFYGDHLIESVRGAGSTPIKSKTGWPYHMPGALTPEQIATLIPKDVLVLNWFWQDDRAKDGRGEQNDIKLSDWGLQQAHINFMPDIQNYARRSARKGVVGGAPSSWTATNEYTFGKDMMVSYLGTANLMWSTHSLSADELPRIVQERMPDIRRRLSGKPLPSDTGSPVRAVRFSGSGNLPAGLPAISGSRIEAAGKSFEIQSPVVVGVEGAAKSPVPLASPAIPIGADVSSIVFLHGTAKAAANDMSYRYIHNAADTADLLGWYEVVYEDGFVATVPVRFGWNILPLTWSAKPDSLLKGSAHEPSYAYAADAVAAGDATLFAYEWVNPRFGKIIREVRLHGSSGFVDVKEKKTPENAIVLAAISFVPKRPAPPMKAGK